MSPIERELSRASPEEASPDAAAEADERKPATSHWERGRPGRNERVSANRPDNNSRKEKRRSRIGMRAERPRSQQSGDSPQKISDYSRDELVSALLKGMGKKWWTREDAIRTAAHRLGFRRTGRQIRDAFKSAITGAIRRGYLEYDGDYIRRVISLKKSSST